MLNYGISSFVLKKIAITSMLIDHVGAVFFPQYIVFRIIGRLAFPIFCFLLMQGYFHTKNIYKYGFRLFIFSLISEIPFDLAFNNSIFYKESQNVFFTLLIGLIVIYFCEKRKSMVSKLMICAIGMVVAIFLNTDYSLYGILLIFIFYIFRENKIYYSFGTIIANIMAIGNIQMFSVFSLIPILLYNGKKGFGSLKYIFYIFYPLHLLILYFLNNHL